MKCKESSIDFTSPEMFALSIQTPSKNIKKNAIEFQTVS